MLTYPSVSQSKAHAKFISRTLNIKLSYAREAVAFMYGCEDFDELSKNAGGLISEDRGTCVVIPCNVDVRMLELLIKPHLAAIRAHFKPNLHLDGSVMDKVVRNKLHCISHDAITSILDRENQVDWTDTRSVIDRLEFVDDTASVVLVSQRDKRGGKDQVNPWIEHSSFGLRVYGYYRFSGKAISIELRELDILFRYPNEYRDISTRKWLSHYVIGFIGWLAKQFEVLGYNGTIELCNINFAKSSVNNFTGKVNQGKLKQLNRSNIKRNFDGLKIPLDVLANQNHPQSIWLRENVLE